MHCLLTLALFNWAVEVLAAEQAPFLLQVAGDAHCPPPGSPESRRHGC